MNNTFSSHLQRAINKTRDNRTASEGVPKLKSVQSHKAESVYEPHSIGKGEISTEEEF